MYSDRSQINESIFSLPDPNSASRAAHQFAKCLNFVNSQSVEDISTSPSTSRSIYKNLKTSQSVFDLRSNNAETPRKLSTNEEEILLLRKEIKDLCYKLQEKDMKIMDLNVQLKEKEKENIELATNYEIEIDSLKKEIVLIKKKSEYDAKEQIQNLEIEYCKEKRTFLQKISNLETSIIDTSPSNIVAECQYLLDSFALIDDFYRNFMEREESNLVLCDYILKEVSRAYFVSYSLTESKVIKPQKTPKTLAEKLEAILDRVQDTLANLHSDYFYFK